MIDYSFDLTTITFIISMVSLILLLTWAYLVYDFYSMINDPNRLYPAINRMSKSALNAVSKMIRFQIGLPAFFGSCPAGQTNYSGFCYDIPPGYKMLFPGLMVPIS